MRRKSDIEARKLRTSLSQEKKLIYTSQFLWTSDKLITAKTPKNRNLVHNYEFEGSNDTCTFPSDLTATCGVQTDPSPCYMESLVLENQSLYTELKCLKSEISDLKMIVKELLQFKKQAKLKANQEIIEMLQAENFEIKRSLDSGKN